MKDADFLKHIKKAIDEIREIAKGVDEEAYKKDIKTQRAVERELQIIGDAVHKLSEGLIQANPDVEWRKIYAARNVVVHFYWGVDQDVLWDVLQTKLGPLYDKVNQLLAQQEPNAATPPAPSAEPSAERTEEPSPDVKQEPGTET